MDSFKEKDKLAPKPSKRPCIEAAEELMRQMIAGQAPLDSKVVRRIPEPEELVGKTLIAITNLPPRAMMGIDSCGMLLSAIHEEEGEEKLHLLMVDDHIPAGAKLY